MIVKNDTTNIQFQEVNSSCARHVQLSFINKRGAHKSRCVLRRCIPGSFSCLPDLERSCSLRSCFASNVRLQLALSMDEVLGQVDAPWSGSELHGLLLVQRFALVSNSIEYLNLSCKLMQLRV